MSNLKFTQKVGIFWKDLLSYFNVKEDLEPQADTEESIRSGISFKGSQLLTLIFAIFIASLGLNTNSVPVIIGAMLISPLMGPIIGMGLGVGIQDIALVRRSLENISAAVIGSLLASAIYFTISPLYDGASQLLARTSPSIYDVFVALFGGAAGILSIASKNKGQVLPGVAIATSLMPPLCTAGYGLATMQMHFFLGALYLFFTNMIFIFFATWIGVKLMGFHKVVYQNEKRARRIHVIAYSIVAATVGVSIYLTVVMVGHNIFIDKAAAFVEKEMVFPNTQVLSHKEFIQKGKRYIDVTLIGEALPKDSLQLALMNKLDSIGLGGTILQIKQGFSLTKADMDADRNSEEFYRMMQTEISRRQITIDSLRGVIASQGRFANEAARIAPEIKVLFPNIRDIACAAILASSTDSLRSDTLNIVLVNAKASLNATEMKKLRDYLEVRLGKKPIEISVNPAGIPWRGR